MNFVHETFVHYFVHSSILFIKTNAIAAMLMTAAQRHSKVL